jgi:hypothetical protein
MSNSRVATDSDALEPTAALTPDDVSTSFLSYRSHGIH